MTVNSKKEELESFGDMPNVCAQIVLKCLYLARIGGLGILCSVNKLARSVTTWTGPCDRRLARLISYIHHTSDYRQYCHVGNTAQQCRLGLKINLGWNHMYLWKSNICSYRLDVQETNVSILLTVPQNQKSFRWMLVCEWITCS